MTWLLQVIMFLILGLLVNPHEMLGVTITAILVSLVHESDSTPGQCVAQPAAVRQ